MNCAASAMAVILSDNVLMYWDTKLATLLHVYVPLTGNKMDSFLQRFRFFLWHLKRITLYYFWLRTWSKFIKINQFGENWFCFSLNMSGIRKQTYYVGHLVSCKCSIFLACWLWTPFNPVFTYIEDIFRPTTTNNSVAFSPQANYTDRATAACWRS
jgi:hypothetical protein